MKWNANDVVQIEGEKVRQSQLQVQNVSSNEPKNKQRNQRNEGRTVEWLLVQQKVVFFTFLTRLSLADLEGHSLQTLALLAVFLLVERGGYCFSYLHLDTVGY